MIQNKFFYILLLVIVIISLLCMNYNTLFPSQESLELIGSTPASQPATNETQSVSENKATTSLITESTYNSKLTNISNQIDSCQSMMNEINSMLPRTINDIQPGTISQTDNLDNVNIDIQTSTTMTMNPVTKKNTPSGQWTINMILPRGKNGEQGIQGIKGAKGETGEMGIQGKRGLQGPWGSEKNENENL